MKTRKTIQYVDLNAQWCDERDELLPIIESVLERGDYVGGEEIQQFENVVAELCNTTHAVSLNSGTDALFCALKALDIGPGDEVITPPNSFISSTAVIVQVGATPVFVDVKSDQNIDPNLIDSVITPRTKAIMPVHLTGRIADMSVIKNRAEANNLYIIEDAAQAIGSRLGGQSSGSFGTVGCFSTHPLKNLNSCGDGGFITTNDHDLAEKVKLIRNHGLENRDFVVRFGQVSRMDTLQAAILNYRIKKLHTVIDKRRHNVSIYRKLLDPNYVYIPNEGSQEFNTYHTFVIQTNNRDDLKRYLLDKGIETAIHYPIPIHLQPAAKRFGYHEGDFPVTEEQARRILTLPVNQYMNDEMVRYVAEQVNKYCYRRKLK